MTRRRRKRPIGGAAQRAALALVCALLSDACAPDAAQRQVDQGYAALRAVRDERHHRTQTGAGTAAAQTSFDEGPLRCERIVAAALAVSPSLRAKSHRVRALLSSASAQAALPMGEVELQVWNLPLARPYALGEADMYMLELRQRFPAAGSRGALASAAAQEAQALLAELAQEERNVVERACTAYAQYQQGLRTRELQQAQLGLLTQMHEAVVARLSTAGSALGEAPVVDLAIADTRRALLRAHAEVTRARSTINALLRRPAGAALGAPENAAAQTVELPVDQLLTRALDRRGELRASKARRAAAKAEREASDAEAAIPEFMLGLGYWQMPNMRPGIGATLGMTLPWLWGGQRDKQRAAQEQELAAAYDQEGARVMVQDEVTQAHTQLELITTELRVLEEQSLPAAQRALDAVHSAYATGNVSLVAWMEAAKAQLTLQLEHTQLLADQARAVATLERVVGEPLPRTSVLAAQPGAVP